VGAVVGSLWYQAQIGELAVAQLMLNLARLEVSAVVVIAALEDGQSLQG
jgi:hypothetical protein